MFSSVKTIIRVAPRGFCAGVSRAVATVEEVLAIVGPPVYIKHAIVHNNSVTQSLAAKGAVTVETIEDVPDGATVIFSAHGSPPCDYVRAKEKECRVIDATCPLVAKVHAEMIRFLSDGYYVIYIGHRGHQEVVGVLGEVALAESSRVCHVETIADIDTIPFATETKKIAVLTQTTLNANKTAEFIDQLQKKFPHLVRPPVRDICFSTTNRQTAVQQIAAQCDVVLVVGDPTSSNSNKLREVAEQCGVRAYLIATVKDLDNAFFVGVTTVGITAGASVPEADVQAIIDYFTANGVIVRDLVVMEENVVFTEPQAVTQLRKERY